MSMSRRTATLVSSGDTVQEPPAGTRRSVPQAGDMLVSERSARADVFTVGVVPAGSYVTVTRYSAAIELVQELARARRVDGWFTNDHTHYARVASYRR